MININIELLEAIKEKADFDLEMVQSIIKNISYKYLFVAEENGLTIEDLEMYAIELLLEYIKDKNLTEIDKKGVFYFRKILSQKMRDYANKDIRIRKKGQEDQFLKIETVSNIKITKDGKIIDIFEDIPEKKEENKKEKTVYHQIFDYDMSKILTKKQLKVYETLKKNDLNINKTAIELKDSWHNINRSFESIKKRVRQEFYKQNNNNFNYNGEIIEDRGLIINTINGAPKITVDYYGYFYNFIEMYKEKDYLKKILESVGVFEVEDIRLSQVDKVIKELKRYAKIPEP